jgi:predicted GIY-YIG superfamily endonuclease
MLHFVYKLIDPRTGVVAYVGITDNPNRRFQAHLNDTKTNDGKRAWIEQLQSEHLEPRMEIIEIVETREEALEREKYWIQWYLQQGVTLVNITRHSTSGQNRIVDNITIESDTPSYIGYLKINMVNGVTSQGVFDEEALRNRVIEDIKRSALYSPDNASDSPKEVFRTHWLK